jgi:hypothetical protein
MNWSNDPIIQNIIELTMPVVTFLAILCLGFLFRALLFMRLIRWSQHTKIENTLQKSLDSVAPPGLKEEKNLLSGGLRLAAIILRAPFGVSKNKGFYRVN